jgi:hypothetical protein
MLHSLFGFILSLWATLAPRLSYTRNRGQKSSPSSIARDVLSEEVAFRSWGGAQLGMKFQTKKAKQ